MATKDVAKATAAGLSGPDAERFIAYITEAAERAPDGSEINDRIFKAETVEDVLSGGAGDAIHAEDITGVPLMLLGVRFNASDVENPNALPAYAVMECVDTQGTSKVITCGATTVMTQLYKLIVLNAFPQAIMIERSKKPTQKGFYPMQLVGAKSAFENGF